MRATALFRFKELWDTADPHQGRQRAIDFVARYPRSVVLREAYEQAARASAVLGDDKVALEWGTRALRLLPENPLLLTMVADLAARHGQHELAEKSGRQALRYLERALAPASSSPDAWPQVRDGLRDLADFALGRTAEEEGRYADAERWLLDALRVKRNGYVALYALGVARNARKDPDPAVRGGGRGYQNSGPLFANLSPRLSLFSDHLRTVLAVKGSLRRAQQRRALDGLRAVPDNAPEKRERLTPNGSPGRGPLRRHFGTLFLRHRHPAAPCFAEVMHAASGALAEAARRELQQVYAAN